MHRVKNASAACVCLSLSLHLHLHSTRPPAASRRSSLHLGSKNDHTPRNESKLRPRDADWLKNLTPVAKFVIARNTRSARSRVAPRPPTGPGRRRFSERGGGGKGFLGGLDRGQTRDSPPVFKSEPSFLIKYPNGSRRRFRRASTGSAPRRRDLFRSLATASFHINLLLTMLCSRPADFLLFNGISVFCSCCARRMALLTHLVRTVWESAETWQLMQYVS